jgi:hypothetical protein
MPNLIFGKARGDLLPVLRATNVPSQTPYYKISVRQVYAPPALPMVKIPGYPLDRNLAGWDHGLVRTMWCPRWESNLVLPACNLSLYWQRYALPDLRNFRHAIFREEK